MGNDEPVVIALADVREALARLMDAAQEQFGQHVDLDADYYWAIVPAAAFDLTEDPAVYSGQLSDDVATVGELLTREDGEIFLWHDLEHVTGILLRVSALARP